MLSLWEVSKGIQVIERLLNNFELFDINGGSLCRLNRDIYLNNRYRDKLIFHDTEEWIINNKPNSRYGKVYLIRAWSWQPGAADPRFYWLKSKLEEYRTMLNNKQYY